MPRQTHKPGRPSRLPTRNHLGKMVDQLIRPLIGENISVEEGQWLAHQRERILYSFSCVVRVLRKSSDPEARPTEAEVDRAFSMLLALLDEAFTTGAQGCVPVRALKRFKEEKELEAKNLRRRMGKKSGDVRRQKRTWTQRADKLAKEIRDSNPSLSQEKLAEEIWLELGHPSHKTLLKRVRELEKLGELRARTKAQQAGPVKGKRGTRSAHNLPKSGAMFREITDKTVFSESP